MNHGVSLVQTLGYVPEAIARGTENYVFFIEVRS